ncbi:MAG: OmpH family outer membrane protein [Alistipes sp.]|jgi:outer membrane protein|nr:OmpH family outer membrane protein [Alistipes sp.]
MKKVLKLTLAVVCVMFSTSLFAQKIGRISSQEVVVNMAEYKEAQTQLEALAKDLQAQMETIQVEMNTKIQEYQKGAETMTDAVRQLKEKELNDLNTRLQEFNQVAQQELQKKEQELMEPIIKKANEAITEVSKAGGYTVIFETGQMIYFDEAQVKDITPEVKAKLGAN